MNKHILAISAAAIFAASSSVASAATYLPVGPQTNVAVSTVTGGGWTQCYSSTYGTPLGNSSAGALANCGTGNIMLAARLVNSETLLVLAQAALADVTFNTGNGNVTHNANGTEWYNSDNYSWGFARGGDSVQRGECDVSSINAAERLCWHTVSFTGGWRAGTNTGLNSSSAFERLIFAADASVGAVPEPATWLMIIMGFGFIGASMRRKRQTVRVSYG
jgi:PEP-CTERM motif